MRYLYDFAWSFYVLLGPLFDVMAGLMVAVGVLLVVFIATIGGLRRVIARFV